MTPYATIVADPPWDHGDGTGVRYGTGFVRATGQKRDPAPGVVTELPYDTLSVEEISALPVGDLAAQDAHLYLWTTNRYLHSVWSVVEAWGFQGVCVITWCKAYRGALGGGAWQANTEFCLFARRGQLPTQGKARGRWYDWPRRFGPPVAQGERRSSMHSAKPEAFLDLVEQVSPGPYLELFARRDRLGWDTWGNESLATADLGRADTGESARLLAGSGLTPRAGSTPVPSVAVSSSSASTQARGNKHQPARADAKTPQPNHAPGSSGSDKARPRLHRKCLPGRMGWTRPPRLASPTRRLVPRRGLPGRSRCPAEQRSRASADGLDGPAQLEGQAEVHSLMTFPHEQREDERG